MDNTRATFNNRSMKYICNISISNSGKSTTMASASIAHRVTASNGYYLNVDCGYFDPKNFVKYLCLVMTQNVIMIVEHMNVIQILN